MSDFEVEILTEDISKTNGNGNLSTDKGAETGVSDTVESGLSPKRGELSQMIRETVRNAVKSAVEDIKAEEKRKKLLKRRKRACKYCKATFSLKWNYKIHIKKIHPEHYKKTKCKLCGIKFKTREKLILHKATHNASLIESRLHRETAEAYCENTKLIFPYRKHYDDLIYSFSKLADGMDEDEYSYDMENRLFRFDPFRRQLLMKVTQANFSFCPKCSQYFVFENKRRRHKCSKKHQEVDKDIQIAYFCMLCNTEFSTDPEYKTHNYLVHDTVRVYNCR